MEKDKGKEAGRTTTVAAAEKVGEEGKVEAAGMAARATAKERERSSSTIRRSTGQWRHRDFKINGNRGRR